MMPLPTGYLPGGWVIGFLSTLRLGRHAGTQRRGASRHLVNFYGVLNKDKVENTDHGYTHQARDK